MKTLNPKVLQTVDATTLKQWLDDNQITLVDFREPSEYAVEHLPNSILLPLSKFELNKIPVEQDRILPIFRTLKCHN